MTSTAAAEEEPAGPCALRPNPHVSEQHEWLSCLSVAAELQKLPAVGETTTLSVAVTAQFDRADVRVDTELPAGFEWVAPPAGMSAGSVRIASVAAGETQRFEGTVRATAAGPADVAVRVFSPADEGAPAPADHVYLTVAERGGASASGMAGRPDGTAVRGGAGATRVLPDAPHKPAGSSPQAPLAPQAATACVTGSWGYQDNLGIARVAPNYTVEVWDDDSFGASDLLGTAATDGKGDYTVCFDNTDEEDIGGGGQDVFVRFVSHNNMWRVQETGTGTLFHYDTDVAPDVPDNTTHDFGFSQPGDILHHRGVQAFDAVNDFWNWIPGLCWDANDAGGTCAPVVVNWRWDSAVGTFYDGTTREISLLADDPNSRDVTVHEATHSVMDDVYEFSPVPGAGGPHGINEPTNVGMAWVEGFAEWTPVRVYNDPNFNWPDGAALNLETPKWGSANWGTGPTVEGRLAGALIDLSDNTNETPWDRLAEGSPGNIWTTFLNHKSNSLAQFWSQRTTDGFNVAPTGGLASLYQNTIDFTFRDPLTSNVPVSRPTPFAPHNFSYNTTTQFWSVVAVRPPAGANYDLKLFDDKAQTVQVAPSAFGGSTVDFVAVNSAPGKQPLGDFYPRVSAISGTGNCAVEWEQATAFLNPATSQTIAMASTQVVAVRDTNLLANVPVTIKVTPSSATQDAELFLVSPNGVGNFRSRLTVFKSAIIGGPGATESMTFTPTAAQAGRYGVIVVNKSGTGTYTLQRL